jgi:hypothetical protein
MDFLKLFSRKVEFDKRKEELEKIKNQLVEDVYDEMCRSNKWISKVEYDEDLAMQAIDHAGELTIEKNLHAYEIAKLKLELAELKDAHELELNQLKTTHAEELVLAKAERDAICDEFLNSNLWISRWVYDEDIKLLEEDHADEMKELRERFKELHRQEMTKLNEEIANLSETKQEDRYIWMKMIGLNLQS